MKRLSSAVAILTAATFAWAASPHFIYATGDINDKGNLVVSFKEAGLANIPITYVLTVASTTANWQCYTKSGNQPQGDPNSTSVGEQTFVATYPPARNGQITGSITGTPEVGSCQGGGLKLCLTSVTYNGVTLTDITSEPDVVANLGNFTETYTNPLDHCI